MRLPSEKAGYGNEVAAEPQHTPRAVTAAQACAGWRMNSREESPMTSMNTGRDVVQFLVQQHNEIKAGFERVISTSGSQREEAFTELRRLLAVHETAEEEVVHPRAKRELDDGETIVDARLEEEHEAKEALSKLEKMDVDSTEFETAFRKLRSDVLAHATAEESREFSQLATELDDDQLMKMRRAVEMAEKTAPTRPHAGAESPAANLVVGPFAAMLDRARDAISGKG
jgi:hemerythrin superfamily protein